MSWRPSPSQHIISEGVLDVGTRLEIFGDEGTWKSATAIHAANCIATGRRWLGFQTYSSNILYIQGEMNLTQTQTRISKYCKSSKQIFLSNYLSNNQPVSPDILESKSESFAFPPNLLIQTINFLHLDEQAGISAVRKDIQTMIDSFPALPIVLIVDPLFKMFRHDLISEQDVKYFTDNIDLMLHDERLFANHPGMALIMVHHSRKAAMDKEGNTLRQGSSDVFGSALLKWWPDTIMQCELDEKDETRTTVNLSFSKHSRIAEGILPKRIGVRWNKATLHPRILYRSMPEYPEDEVEERGGEYLSTLE